jgi:hypothetical protein
MTLMAMMRWKTTFTGKGESGRYPGEDRSP